MSELKGRAPNQYPMRCIAVLSLVHAVDLGAGKHSLGEQTMQFERLAGFAPAALDPFGAHAPRKQDAGDVLAEEGAAAVVTPRGRTELQEKLVEAGRNFTPLSSSSLEADRTKLTSWVQELELELGPSSNLRDGQTEHWQEDHAKAWESPMSFLSTHLQSARQLVQRVSFAAKVTLVTAACALVAGALAWRAHVNSREDSAVRIQAAYRGATERASILSAVSEASETRRALSDQHDES